MGHVFAGACDGLAPVEMVNLFKPEPVILDIGMPRLHSYDAAARIRSKLGASVQLLALTGWATAQDKQRAMDAGFEHHMVKPPDFKLLDKLIPQH